jgi:acylpyruvate hydrolase
MLRPLRGISELGVQTPITVLNAAKMDDHLSFRPEDVRFLPVIPNPSKVTCVGQNFHAHIEECAQATPAYPVFFAKFATSLIGPTDAIELPAERSRLDYEAELAVVIGRDCRRVSPQQAGDYIAGYTVANDVTMRDYQFKTHQWLAGKAWDKATPLGPYLVTPDEVGDVRALDITLQVNGDVRQHASTNLMIYDVYDLGPVVNSRRRERRVTFRPMNWRVSTGQDDWAG